MSSSAPYTSDSPLQPRPRLARVGSLSPAVPEASDTPDSPPAYNQASKRRLTICVVGSGGVGKSSLTVRYLNNHFPEVCVTENTCYMGAYRNNILFPPFISLQFYDPTVGEFVNTCTHCVLIIMYYSIVTTHTTYLYYYICC